MAGDYFAFEEFVTSAKMNKLADDTFTGVAQNAYQTLQANNVFENKDFLAADEFVDAEGTNVTVDIIPTYDSATDTYSGTVYTNTTNAYDKNDSTFAFNTSAGNVSVYFGNTFAATTISYIRIKAYQQAGTSENPTIRLESYNGSVWSNEQTWTQVSGNLTIDVIVYLNKSIQGLRLHSTAAGAGASGRDRQTYLFGYDKSNPNTAEHVTDHFECKGGAGSYTSSTIEASQNIKTLAGTEDAICIYADKTTPTNTSITVDISDGTTTLSAQELDTVIDKSTLTAAAELELTFNLNTTNVNNTPTLSGWGLYIK